MNSELHRDQVFDIVNWPVLALAAPILGVIAGLVVANIAYRLWLAGMLSVPIVVVLTVVPMLLFGYLIWNTPRGQLQVNQAELLLDRILFFDRRVSYSGAELSLVRWYTDRSQIARGVQLWIDDGSNILKIGVADQSLMDRFDEKFPSLIQPGTGSMPQAELVADDFNVLLTLLAENGLHLPGTLSDEGGSVSQDVMLHALRLGEPRGTS